MCNQNCNQGRDCTCQKTKTSKIDIFLIVMLSLTAVGLWFTLALKGN